MTYRIRVLTAIVVSVILFALAYLLWAFQVGKLKIFGAEQTHEKIFSYQTANDWEGGTFSGTNFVKTPNFLAAKFTYDTTSTPPFDTATVRCDEGDSRCLGGNLVVKFSQTGFDTSVSETVTFSNDGVVVDSVSGLGRPSFRTCYSGEEMSNLVSMIDGSGFWAADSRYQATATDQPVRELTVKFRNKEKTVSADLHAASFPEKLEQLFSNIKSWPIGHSDITGKTCFPTSGWGSYVVRSTYTSSAIGSVAILGYKSFTIDEKSVFLPIQIPYNSLSFQFAGSSDGVNWSSFTSEARQTASCVISPCVLPKVSVDLTKFAELTKAKFIKVKINYFMPIHTSLSESSELCVAGDSGCAPNITTRTPLVAGFTLTAEESGLDVIPPTAPASLQARALGETSIELTWPAGTDNVATNGYNINNVDKGTIEGTTDNSTLTYVVGNLSAGTTYRFNVRTKDTSNNLSDPSPTVTIATIGTSDGDNDSDTTTSPTTQTVSASPIDLPTVLATTASSAVTTSATAQGRTVAMLVSTGQYLWVNFLIAAVLSALFSWFIMRRST